MLGVQVSILSVILFVTGCETAAPGCLRSVMTAAAQVTASAREQTYVRLCDRVRLSGGACPA